MWFILIRLKLLLRRALQQQRLRNTEGHNVCCVVCILNALFYRLVDVCDYLIESTVGIVAVIGVFALLFGFEQWRRPAIIQVRLVLRDCSSFMSH